MLERAVHLAYRRIARSDLIVSAVVRLRNQLDHIVRYYFGDTFYDCEDAEDRLLSTLGPHLKRFVDVGANVGRFSSQLLKYAPPDCQGLLFEPSSSALAVLRQSAGADPRMRVLPVAAGETDRTVRFHEDREAGELSTLVPGAASEHGQWVSVPMRSVDSVLREHHWDNVDLVKIDAEGYDLHVLEGLTDALQRRSIKCVQFEYNASWQASGCLLSKAAELLQTCGYELFLLRADGLFPIDVTRYGEYFAYSNYVGVSADGRRLLGALISNGKL